MSPDTALATGRLELGDNTNLFGVPPAAATAAATAAAGIARYPSPDAAGLRAALSRYTGAPAEAIVTGCGSDDVLDCAMRALAAPGDALAFTVPTFSMIPELARSNHLRVRPVPLGPDGQPDVGRLVEGDPALVYLCSPNNPTGTAIAAAVLERVLEGSRAFVILDQAYAEFESRGLAPPLEARDRVLVTRTLSKAFGLAGLRVGYGVAVPSAIARLEHARGPYKVGRVSEAAAVAALTDDLDWVAARAAQAAGLRDRLIAALVDAGRAPLPSAGNFALIPVPDADAAAAMLETRGVRVRAFPALEGLGDAIRVTVGPWPMMARFLAALAEVPR